MDRKSDLKGYKLRSTKDKKHIHSMDNKRNNNNNNNSGLEEYSMNNYLPQLIAISTILQ